MNTSEQLTEKQYKDKLLIVSVLRCFYFESCDLFDDIVYLELDENFK